MTRLVQVQRNHEVGQNPEADGQTSEHVFQDLTIKDAVYEDGDE